MLMPSTLLADLEFPLVIAMLDLSSLNIAALQHRILDHGLSSSAIIASLLAIFLAERIWSYQRGIWVSRCTRIHDISSSPVSLSLMMSTVQRVANLPGIRCLFEPFTALASFLPQSECNPTVDFTWQRRYSCTWQTCVDIFHVGTLSTFHSVQDVRNGHHLGSTIDLGRAKDLDSESQRCASGREWHRFGLDKTV